MDLRKEFFGMDARPILVVNMDMLDPADKHARELIEKAVGWLNTADFQALFRLTDAEMEEKPYPLNSEATLRHSRLLCLRRGWLVGATVDIPENLRFSLGGEVCAYESGLLYRKVFFYGDDYDSAMAGLLTEAQKSRLEFFSRI
jgi:hypothetical protein